MLHKSHEFLLIDIEQGGLLQMHILFLLQIDQPETLFEGLLHFIPLLLQQFIHPFQILHLLTQVVELALLPHALQLVLQAFDFLYTFVQFAIPRCKIFLSKF